METFRGWWTLTWSGVDKLNDSDKDHIGESIKRGFTSGEIIQESEKEMTFRDLIDQHSELMDINYRKQSILDILKEYGYKCTSEDNCEYEYSDFKGYLNLQIEKI